jgi:hypothetical protein
MVVPGACPDYSGASSPDDQSNSDVYLGRTAYHLDHSGLHSSCPYVHLASTILEQHTQFLCKPWLHEEAFS